jgi:hypothetical protein
MKKLNEMNMENDLGGLAMFLAMIWVMSYVASMGWKKGSAR